MAVLARRLCLFTIACWAVQSSLYAAPPAATEYDVKAAFLCSFAEFVDWPAGNADRGVTIGILGKDPFGAVLEATVRNRAIQNRPLSIRKVSDVDEAARCQIVYVSGSERRDIASIIQALGSSAVLTVSDIPGFAGQGGVIGFMLEDQRIRFEINVAAADRAGLRISSRLLKLARIVGAGSRAGE